MRSLAPAQLHCPGAAVGLGAEASLERLHVAWAEGGAEREPGGVSRSVVERPWVQCLVLPVRMALGQLVDCSVCRCSHLQDEASITWLRQGL